MNFPDNEETIDLIIYSLHDHLKKLKKLYLLDASYDSQIIFCKQTIKKFLDIKISMLEKKLQ